MSVQLDPTETLRTDGERVEYARAVLQIEIEALERVRDRLDESIAAAAQRIFQCRGCVIVTGMGKAGLVGQKIAATLASTGTRAYPLHPAEAVHGDLGRIRPEDLVLVLSHSGETEEIVRLLPAVRRIGAELMALTSRDPSTLTRAAAVVINLGNIEEACPLGLAPSASTTAMMAVGDALALLVSRMRDFKAEDFAFYHPAGSLGLKLRRVEDVMRTGPQIRMADFRKTVREVFRGVGGPGRRTGAVLLVDPPGRLRGIFTDSDLAKLLGRRQDQALDLPIAEVMTASPTTLQAGARVAEAIAILSARKISELPVIDAEGRPIGIIDITDLIGLVPAED